MATFLIEHYESSPRMRSNSILAGDPRKTGHYTATSSSSVPLDVFAFLSKMRSRVTARRYNLMACLIFRTASSRLSPAPKALRVLRLRLAMTGKGWNCNERARELSMERRGFKLAMRDGVW